MNVPFRVTRYGFAAPHDVPIPYLQRIRDYYQALAIMRGCLSGYTRAVALMRPKGALVSRVRGLPAAGTPGFVI